MPKINLLPKEISELIAAGEVVERPASVVKELVENSIDAKAKHITVEIKNGGVRYIRIADDGCGIAHSDVPTAFLRHATSKISSGSDLDAIMTLGFRGEALAATCAVSKVELFTKTCDEQLGTHYVIEGGQEISYEETGCPEGTTIIIRDIFYNTPARMKFLKTDIKEGSNVSSVMEKVALSHPEISFKFIRDGKAVLSTSGDGKLESVIYSVLGRDFLKSLIPANAESGGLEVTGFICKPVYCRPSRSGQFVFLNGRLVRSGTVTAAVEQAYKNSAMIGKFPAFVLNLKVPFETVDVNVHPSKLEVRFSDEKRIFDAVYYAVRNAISQGDTHPQAVIPQTPKKTFFEHMTSQEYRQQSIKPENEQRTKLENTKAESFLRDDEIPLFLRQDVRNYVENIQKKPDAISGNNEVSDASYDENINPCSSPTDAERQEPAESPDTNKSDFDEDAVIFVGEAFSTYIIAEKGKSLYFIDKHAAHERIIFNELKEKMQIEKQTLLIPLTVRLEPDEYAAAITNSETLSKAGFEIEDFGNNTVVLRTMPSVLKDEDAESVLTEATASLIARGGVQIDRLDDIYHTVACKAAIKAGYITSDTELSELAAKVLSDKNVMYCPHGRPVAIEFKKSQLEKQFGRIQ